MQKMGEEMVRNRQKLQELDAKDNRPNFYCSQSLRFPLKSGTVNVSTVPCSVCINNKLLTD